MARRPIHIDCFSVGIDDLPRKEQRDDEKVLEILRETKRFSAFEASSNNDIARTMTRLLKSRIETDKNSQYPWTDITAIDGVPV